MTYVFIVFLAVASATTYHVFIFPNKFAPAGVGGITTMVQYAFGFSAGYLTLIVNVPLAVLVFFSGTERSPSAPFFSCSCFPR